MIADIYPNAKKEVSNANSGSECAGWKSIFFPAPAFDDDERCDISSSSVGFLFPGRTVLRLRKMWSSVRPSSDSSTELTVVVRLLPFDRRVLVPSVDFLEFHQSTFNSCLF